MPTSQLLIETDVLADYLVTPTGQTSLLRAALQKFVCYTTMINALELFRASSMDDVSTSALRHDAVLSTLYLVRVLGFNARYAEPFATLIRKAEAVAKLKVTSREAMILGLADASKLTILTQTNFERYTKFGIVPVLNKLPIE